MLIEIFMRIKLIFPAYLLATNYGISDTVVIVIFGEKFVQENNYWSQIKTRNVSAVGINIKIAIFKLLISTLVISSTCNEFPFKKYTLFMI